MKSITWNQKIKVVKLFLGGLSYDEIAQQVGIAKGSVVNITGEFRDGILPLPPGMAEYVDVLRQLAVDLKKHNTSIAQAKSYLKLHVKLKDMGVDSDEVEQWLDICGDIASPIASNSQFIKAALELAKLTSDTDFSYESLLDDYHGKLKTSEALNTEIERKDKELEAIKLKHKEEKEQTAKELDSITKAIATAQDTFSKQKKELKADLDECLAQNKLTLQEVKTAAALVNSGLKEACLTEKATGELSSRIAAAGSLDIAISELEEKRDLLAAEVDQLAQEKSLYTENVDHLKAMNENLINTMVVKGQEDIKLDAEIQSRTKELDDLKEKIALMVHDMYISQLILSFLVAPGGLSDYNLDHLVSLMVALRQIRLGVGGKQVADACGNIICECAIPKIHHHLELGSVDMDQARQQLALYLAPLVREKFVTRLEYEMVKIDVSIAKADAILQAKGL